MMARVFSGLAAGNVLVLIATAGFGWFATGVSPDRHILLGVFGLLISVFVQVLTFTYFTVTGKIVFQAVHLAGFDQQASVEVKRLKRSMTFHLLAMVLGIVGITISGAIQWRTGTTGAVHLITALGFLPIACGVLAGEYGLIIRNASLLAQATSAYEAWRRSRSKAPVRKLPQEL